MKRFAGTVLSALCLVASACAVPTARSAALPVVAAQNQAAEPMRTVTVNGVRMAYTDVGRGTPIVFVHGFPLNHHIWQAQQAALSTGHRVITVDLPGFGASAPHPDGSSMRQFADDLAALIRALKTGPVVLAGHSMGGYTALAFTKAYPQLLKGLVLVATEPDLDSPDVAATYAPSIAAVQQKGVQAVIDDFAPIMLGQPNPALDTQVRQIMATASVPGVIGSLIGMRDRADCSDVLPKIAVPTMILVGTADQVIQPVKSERMAAVIKGVHYVSFPGVGHLPMLERPEDTTQALSSWLATSRL